MIDLSTNYGPLKLKTPLVAASSGLTDSVESLKELEKHGAGAVVLKSLFEEEILREMDAELQSMGSSSFVYPETLEFYDYNDSSNESTANYLDFIKQAKKAIDIPVIASINCLDAEQWTYFPKRIAEAGADALELNIFNLPSDLNKSAEENEEVYFKIISEVLKQITIPVFIKLSSYSSSLASFLAAISKTGISGIVLFNRFYNPDIDIDSMEITSGGILSSPTDAFNTLRWVAIMAERVDCDLIASTGIHDAEAVIKQLLVGATAVQLASVLYKEGIPYLAVIRKELEAWMEKKGFEKLSDFRSRLSQSQSENPAVYSRVQFMKYFRGFPVS